ncbi:MAG: hypothetical protein HZA67_12005 [Rhodospirillales bacterium]|nr:hypothetical protein [Rhodospirillales bacterium]
MTKHRQLYIAFGMLIGLVFGVAMGPTLVQAAMAVFDSSNLVKNAETALNTAQQLAKLTSLLKEAEETKKSIGTGSDASGVIKILNVGSSGGVLGQSRGIMGAVPDLGRTLGSSSGLGSDASSAIQAVRTILGAPDSSLIVPDQAKLESQRVQARSNARSEALGVALFVRKTLPDSVNKLSQLGTEASAAAQPDGDLRKQVAALTSATLFQIEEQLVLRQLIAALVQMQATEGLATERVLFTQGSKAASTNDGTSGTVFGK